MINSTHIPAWVDGVLTPVDKLDAHRQGLRHPAISVFVFAAGQVLLQQRAAEKYHTPGLWANACCTHPHWDEPATSAAQRRLREELGLNCDALEHRGQLEYRADVGGGLIEHEVVDLFTLTLEQRPTLALNPAEVQAVRWVDPSDLRRDITAAPERFTPWLRIYIAQYAGMIPGL